ncbi:MAG: histidine-type phosphatase, partial [Bacteroidota bacterium]|nr:histidine-type phosphatase [Bacteroidota bacterium]
LLPLCFVCLSFFPMQAQTTKNELFSDIRQTAGVLYAYPVVQSVQTPAPDGYEPFYISHYGRHGSRYLTNESDYKWVLDVFKKAQMDNALTLLGRDVYFRLERLWKITKNRSGDLTPLGVSQQRGLAERMFNSFPEAFGTGSNIKARSTIVIRCILSMDAFCERLKELNPALTTDRDASQQYMEYLNYRSKRSINFSSEKGPWRDSYRKLEASLVHPQRLISTLFSDTSYIGKKHEPTKLMFALYSLAGNMQDLDTDISFYDLFEKEELFDLFQCANYELYVCFANAGLNNGMAVDNEKHLLADILDSADKAIAEHRKGADLRFGHDTVITPLAAILHLGTCDTTVYEPTDCYKAWSINKVTPMAANIQLIFFRKNGSDDILVKFLLNEKETTIPVKSDVAPFYHWKDVETYYRELCK